MDWTELIIVSVKCSVVLGGIMLLVPFLVLAERKICARIQDRIGPNRVGPFGLLQTIADGIKLAFKEDLTPAAVDRWLYTIAPAFVMMPALIAFAIIPFGKDIELFGRTIPLQISNPDIGILFFLAIAALAVFGLAIGGWASNNKYSLLGGLRASAQLISYEVALVLTIAAVILAAGTLQTREIVLAQTEALWTIPGTPIYIPSWNLFLQPLGFIIFYIAAFAETNRLPFDLPEAEAELVGGYHTEYSSLRFALFFMGEYAAMVTMSAVIVTLYFGGWHLPGVTDIDMGSVMNGLVSVGVFAGKVAVLLFIYIWVRWTLPRFRYNDLMGLAWKVLIPLSILNLLVTGWMLL